MTAVTSLVLFVWLLDVMLSYSESDGAGAAETPGTEALFKLKRSF